MHWITYKMDNETIIQLNEIRNRLDILTAIALLGVVYYVMREIYKSLYSLF